MSAICGPCERGNHINCVDWPSRGNADMGTSCDCACEPLDPPGDIPEAWIDGYIRGSEENQ